MDELRMVHIRRFCDEDAPQLWQLFFNTIRTVNRKDYTADQVKAWAVDDLDPELWLQKMQSIEPFVAEIDQAIVGYSDLQSDGLIDHFFCHHAHQNKGVGRVLMQHIFSEAERRGIDKLYSHVSITAKPFYLHFGFEVIKQQTLDVRGEQLINFCLEKSLSRDTVI